MRRELQHHLHVADLGGRQRLRREYRHPQYRARHHQWLVAGVQFPEWPAAAERLAGGVLAVGHDPHRHEQSAWNNSIPTNGVFNVAFNGTFNGANNPPTAFTLNGTACTIGNSTNTPPTVPVTRPRPTARPFPPMPPSTSRPMPADPGGAVDRVEFRAGRHDWWLNDTASPYATTFASGPGLAAARTRCTATAFDNGTPALSMTSRRVTVTGARRQHRAAGLTHQPRRPARTSRPILRFRWRRRPLIQVAPWSAWTSVSMAARRWWAATRRRLTTSRVPAGLANGSHTVTATAVDNGSPALSTTTPQ